MTTINPAKRLSDNLREMYDDMVGLYNNAKINDNPAGMERLSKLIIPMAKQIKEHEIYERETATRKSVLRSGGGFGSFIGDILKKWDGKILDASAVIIEIFDQGMSELDADLDK